MRRNTLLSGLTGIVLGLCLSLGGAVCLQSAFSLEADPSVLLFGTLAALVTAWGCFRLRYGAVVLSVLLVALTGYALREGSLEAHLEALLWNLGVYYDAAYGCGWIWWTEADHTGRPVTLALLAIGVVVGLLVSWVVFRRRPAVFAIVPSLLPLAVCLVVTDTEPSRLGILALVFGILMLVLTQTVRRRDAAAGDRLSALLAVPAAVALIVLFSAVPRQSAMQAQLRENVTEWALNQAQRIATLPQVEGRLPEWAVQLLEKLGVEFSGLDGGRVNLAATGTRSVFDIPVMEVTAGTGGTIYLREKSYAEYDGVSWAPAPDAWTEAFEIDPEVAWETETWEKQIFRIRIRTRTTRSNLLLPYLPLTSEHLVLKGGRVENTRQTREYTMNYLSMRDSWKEEWLFGQFEAVDGENTTISSGSSFETGTDSEELWMYLQLPQSTRTEAERFVEELIPHKDFQPVWCADKVGAMVQRCARYSLQPEGMPEGTEDFALWFLREADSGYCVHFATTAVVLLRALGIPARYVEGYAFETIPDATVLVTEKMAHAWAEYYVRGIGWVVLEATPSDAIAENIPSQVTRPMPTTAPTETRPTTDPAQTSGPTSGTPAPTKPQPSGNSAGSVGSGQKPTEQQKPPRDWGILPQILETIGVVLAVAVVGIGQSRLRLWLWRRRVRRRAANGRGLLLGRRAGRMARSLGIPVPRALQELVQKAGFSQHTLTAEELAQFRGFLREGTQRLSRRRWYRRIWDRLVLALY